MPDAAYQDRLVRETRVFADQEHVHDLPPAADLWSARHVLPKLRDLGVPTLDDFILDPIRGRAARTGELVVLSLGSGNGDLELGWLDRLRTEGVTNVRLRLLELNPRMQERAAAKAAELGLADRVELLVADFNTWQADRRHDVVIGYQALHHVLELEHLFAQVADCLAGDGVLLVNDMIGRNGHRRWPEALEVVERVWATLPPELRVNSITGQVDDTYADIDCAADGFEGIRAQDVLPTLLDHWHPGLFLPFGNVIDPFVDRVYGHNFLVTDQRHRAIIESVGDLDDALVDLGVVTPTHLIAAFHPGMEPLRCHGSRTPDRSYRDPAVRDPAGRVSFHPATSDPGGLIHGPAVVTGRLSGVDHDRWAGPLVDIPLVPADRIRSIGIDTYLPDWMPANGRLTVHTGATPLGTIELRPGLASTDIAVDLPARRPIVLTLSADHSVVPSLIDQGTDERRLAYVLTGVHLR